MLADSALHNGCTALFLKDLLLQPKGLAEITSFLPLFKFKVEDRLPLAQRIVIVTDNEHLNRACGKFGYKERKAHKKRIIDNYFDGAEFGEYAKWKVWILDLAGV